MKTGVVPRQLTYEVRTIERTAEVGLDDLGLPANERASAAAAPRRRRRMINWRLKVFAIAEEREVFLPLSRSSFFVAGYNAMELMYSGVECTRKF